VSGPGAWAIVFAILAQAFSPPLASVLSGLPGGTAPASQAAPASRTSPASGTAPADSTAPAGQATEAGYPYAGATCEFGAAGGPDCANPRDHGDFYDWGYAGTAGRPFQASDPWGYEYRNCTSYVAWRLARARVPGSLFRDLGNAGQWIAGVAGERGVVVNQVPSPGAVAVWVIASSVGHVAWVDSVRPGAAGVAITVSDYNDDGTGAYAVHLMTSPPSGYIHFPG
jgi:surface antigen